MNESTFTTIDKNEGLVRDKNTRTILNISNNGYEKRKRQKQIAARNNNQMDRIENDLSQIKLMLQELLNTG